MKAPNIYKLENLTTLKSPVDLALIDDRWVPARPVGYYSFRWRLKAAWLAFTGQCDLVKWPGNQ